MRHQRLGLFISVETEAVLAFISEGAKFFTPGRSQWLYNLEPSIVRGFSKNRRQLYRFPHGKTATVMRYKRPSI